MLETHPFKTYCPKQAKYLLLGSFTGKIKDPSYNWYYANKRNHFWPILESVYGLDLSTKTKKQALFSKLKLAVGDIILSCERSQNNNLDTNLTNIVFNTEAIRNVVTKNSLKQYISRVDLSKSYSIKNLLLLSICILKLN